MVFLGIIAVCLLWLALALLMTKYKAFGNNYEGGVFFSLIVMVVMIFLSTLSFFIARYTHYDNFADYQRTEKNIEVYE